MTKEELIALGGGGLKRLLGPAELSFPDVNELRLRADRPVILKLGVREVILKSAVPTETDVRDIASAMGSHSLYAYEEELRNGFITLSGGHRLGICGQAVVEDGKVRSFKNISSLNLRVTHQIMGCADAVLPRITKPRLRHTLIISPPSGGKTTLLRDIIRQLSDGGSTVGLVDERSEIAGCYQGIPQNDVGLRTDVIDAAPKAEGMVMLLRSMSPEVIAVDEIGGAKDTEAIESVMNAGITVICTLHGNNLSDARRLAIAGSFGLFIVLSGKNNVGRVAGIYDNC